LTLDRRRLASVLDTGEELQLTWPPPRARALRACARGLLLTVSTAMLFAGGFLLGTVCNPVHALRGAHQHLTPCRSTRGTCTDAP
jgi:hypothetical protein